MTSDKAASLKTSLEAAGLQIEAAMTRQNDQQAFTAQQNAQKRADDFKKLHIQVQQWYANFLRQTANNMQAREDGLAKQKVALGQSLASGEITQEEYQQLLEVLK